MKKLSYITLIVTVISVLFTLFSFVMVADIESIEMNSSPFLYLAVPIMCVLISLLFLILTLALRICSKFMDKM